MVNIPVNDKEIPTAQVIVDPPSDVTEGEEKVCHIPIAHTIESDTRSITPPAPYTSLSTTTGAQTLRAEVPVLCQCLIYPTANRC